MLDECRRYRSSCQARLKETGQVELVSETSRKERKCGDGAGFKLRYRVEEVVNEASGEKFAREWCVREFKRVESIMTGDVGDGK